MKVANMMDSNIIFDDIDVLIGYNKSIDVDDRLVKRSVQLRKALEHGWVKEVKEDEAEVSLEQAHEIAAKTKAEELYSPKIDEPEIAKPAEEFASLDITEHPESNNIKREFNPADEREAERKELEKLIEHHPSIHRPSYSSIEKYQTEDVMDIEYTGPMLDAGGFAKMNRKCVFGLDKRGVNIRPQIVPSIPDIDMETGKKLGSMSKRKVGKGSPKIFGMTAPGVPGWGGHKIFYTMMETYTLHKDYVGRCGLADELWLPSQWNIDIFKKNGVHTKMVKMPLGVDVDMYKPGLKPLQFSEMFGSDFVFLSLFGWSYRKGYDVLLKAFLSEFSRDDDVTLVISARYFGSTDEVKKQKIRDDVEVVKRSVDNPNPPRILLFGDVMPEEMLPRLYNSADCFVLVSRGEGWGLPCHPKGTMVYTEQGEKCISEIKAGDMVYTHTGNLQLVEQSTSRFHEGSMNCIKLRGSSEPIYATSNHPILTAKRNGKKYANINSNKLELESEWMSAGKIQKDDFILVPKIDITEGPSFINISDFVDGLHAQDDLVYSPHSYLQKNHNVSYSTMSRDLDETVGYVYKALNLGLQTDRATRVRKYAKKSKYEKPKPAKCQDRIDLSSEIMEFFGLYIAEGSSNNKTRSELSSHKKESLIRQKEVSAFKSMFPESKELEKISKISNRAEVVFSSSIASKLFAQLFNRGASNKRIPKFMYGCKNVGSLIRGLFMGDGCLQDWSLSTSSRDLVRDVWMILNANGIYTYRYKSVREGKKNPEWIVRVPQQYRDRFLEFTGLKLHGDKQSLYRPVTRYVLENDNYYFVPVLKNTTMPYSGMVYNMHVKEDNSYLVNGYSSHNCCEAGACEIPVISSNYSGHTEFLDKTNSYLVDVDHYVISDDRISWISHFYEGQKFPAFGPQAVEQTREYMREVYENQAKAKKKAKKLRKNLVDNYTWDHCVDRIYNRLQEIYQKEALK